MSSEKSLATTLVQGLDPAGDWKAAFAEHSADSFAHALAEDVILEASILNMPVVGRDNIKRVMEAASKI
jgi:ketosteroid isomerase-like protein